MFPIDLSILAFASICVACYAGTPPHLLHIVADDIGWNDLGFVNSKMRTPHIDKLVNTGIEFTRFYAQKECAPSRSSIMTGRLPFKYGYYENPSDDGGIPKNYTLLPEVLKANGYRTHAIGKWHCGFRTPGHTPTKRGFDSFLGYWHWGEEYTDHVFPPYYKEAKCRGVDFTRATGSNIRPVLDLNGTPSTSVFVDEFERILQAHPGGTPFYIYLAFQNAHDPYENAPPELVTNYDASMTALRRNYSAIIEDLDNAIGRVVDLLKSSGFWKDTVILFTSDNGGEMPFADQSACTSACQTTGCCGGAGNNHPLRGGKFSLFEGGIRSRAFIHAKEPLMPSSRQGSKWNGFSHVSDVFATMAGLAGAMVTTSETSVSSGGATSLSLGSVVGGVQTDGFDLWNAIVQNGVSPRKELVHQPLNVYWNASCTVAATSNPFLPSCGASITVWPHKLFVGFPGDSRVVKADMVVDDQLSVPEDKTCTEVPCLYNVETDPSEANDLAAKRPDLVQSMSRRLRELSAPEAVPQPADALTPVPSDLACAVVQATGAWQPWQQEQQAQASESAPSDPAMGSSLV